jgi:hypothetical protein
VLFFYKGSRTHSDPKFDRRGGGVSYIDERKKVPEHCSSLCSSEKELHEQRSGAFHHKNTPYETEFDQCLMMEARTECEML